MTRSFVGLYFEAPLFAVVIQLGIGTNIEDPVLLGISSVDYRQFVEAEVADCVASVKQSFDRNPGEKCEIIGQVVEFADRTTMTLTNDDLILAKTKSEVNLFCQKRAQIRYLAQNDGISAREEEIVSGIPAECIPRVVVYGNFHVSLSDLDPTIVDIQQLTADIMGLVAGLHTVGFVHTSLSTDAFGVDSTGRLQIGRLGSAMSLLRLRRGDVQLVPDAVGWIKKDWVELSKRVVPHFLGDTDLAWAMLDNAERSSFELGRPFNFQQWIEVLTEGADFERVPRGHSAVGDTQFVTGFNQANRDCITALADELSPFSELGALVCPPSELFSVAEHGLVRVENPTAPEGDFHGKYGFVFKIASQRAVMKVYISTDDRNTLCSEKSMLQVLRGFNGLSPRVFGIVDGVHDACKMKSFVMEMMGDDDIDILNDVWDSEKPEFYKFVARVLEILESLHDVGILHGDLHVDNMKIGDLSDIGGSVSLIDFGLSTPYVDENGNHLLNEEASRREDMQRFAMEFSEVLSGQTSLIKDFRQEMELLGREERPNYQKWIRLFRYAGAAME